ncbi:acetyl-CoA synthetase [Panacagrimonas perspica]|uniref:Acetyl-CoA synthetase n=1 Tax=Panacagrimonas perspica TaxID=381431 RepID=A0A4R7PCQ1_9GAMM|nr:AMP-binding protein [Panacagrimonas perspica]TDU31915.1 acetyl-CoA synthetase [Panacagrimonas perspica]THD04236.1 AMP-dependent synthetase [Panacagrimonas perspica]
MTALAAYRAARDLLIRHREDYTAAMTDFRWPEMPEFNWALDHFDDLARGNKRAALRIVDESGTEVSRSFEELRVASDRAANFLRRLGVGRGDRLLVMLPNRVELWELMLAAMKLGAVLSPATMLLSEADLKDRIERGQMRAVIVDAANVSKFAGIADGCVRVSVGKAEGWSNYQQAADASKDFKPDGVTRADDPCVLYFTSGTTSKPKMVLHTQRSYPVGHLSTMYWLGLREDDVHLNISSPGWAKHAWSCFFAPWTIGATVFVYNQGRFDADKTLATLARCGVTTLCAPPTAWRALILEDLTKYKLKLRELVSAGEPLNPEVIERVKAAWGHVIREGYGQTESTAMLGNPPGQPVRYGSMGRPLPGYRLDLLDSDGKPVDEGEVSVSLDPRPAGVMAGYAGDEEKSKKALGGTHYGTGDVASRDADGFFWFVGRTDDVFKSSDYRISPFELESALIEHEAVAEAAVVESPDPKRLCVPKACVILKPGFAPDRETAKSILSFTRTRLAPYQKIRIIEFCDLPKTVSGKIRRTELRASEAERRKSGQRGENEFFETDFPELLDSART